MARDWRNKHVADHRNLQASTFSIDSSGQNAVLAGRRHMAIVPLNDPSTILCRINRDSKWDVSTSRWNLHHKEMFVAACNQSAELFQWTQDSIILHSELKAHTRAISDLDWSTYDANLLATASVDTFIHLWDMRDSRKPSNSLHAVAGAFQVKWNRILQYVLATSHEGDIRLWDTRKCSSPLQYITAHLSKIHSIDWCPTEENMLASASQDYTVKFWDVINPQRKADVLSLRCPVWRALYTPFGSGLMTVVVPPLRRGDNSLLLWNLKSLASPLHAFYGHSDVIVDFGWRKPAEDSREFELVTYAKDYTIRVWTVDVALQKACGLVDIETDDLGQLHQNYGATHPISMTSPASPVLDNEGIVIPSFRSNHRLGMTQIPKAQPQNLQQEFSLVNLNIPNVIIEQMDATKRLCIVTAESGKFIVHLKLTFPTAYPFNAPPTFDFSEGTNVDDSIQEKLLKVLKMVSQQQVRRNKSCLEPCLRQLVSALNKIDSDNRDQYQTFDSPFYLKGSKQSFVAPSPHYSFQDVSVPFPRSSGARFCGADQLVVFTRPPHLQRINAPTDDTPRSLSALAGYISSNVIPIKTRSSSTTQYSLVYNAVGHGSSGDNNSLSISSFYQHEKKQKVRPNNTERRASGPKVQSNCGAVLVYSIAKLMSINYILAENYVLYSHDMLSACMKNTNVAAAAGCRDLVQVWSLASLILAPIQNLGVDAVNDVPWAFHPFGRKLLHSLILHYIKKHDIQTAAMLVCVFHNKPSLTPVKKVADIGSCNNTSPGGSPYHTVGIPADSSSENWILGAALKRNRSNSWSDSIEEYRFFERGLDDRDSERESYEADSRLLDPELSPMYDRFKKVYADILYRWNLLEQRAQVLRFLSVIEKPEKRKGVDFITECQHCHKDSIGAQCHFCKKSNFCCSICHIAVKGFASFCIFCGHGGHTIHMEEWFNDIDVCPSGCGCKCLEACKVLGS